MAVNSDTTPFDRTLAQLIRLSDRVQLRKKWCTKVCQDCQQLIRPWPRRFGFAETGKSISEEQLSEGKIREQESSGDCLTSSDLDHLRMIEDALKKAGKTRQVFHAKFEDSKVLPKSPATETASRSGTIAKDKVSYDSGDASVKTYNSQATNIESDARLSGTLSRRERNHSLPDINSNHTQKVRPAGQTNTNARKSSDVAVISQTALDCLRTSALSRSNSSKSVVAAKKSGSTTSSAKYKPAHVMAPFLTTTQLGSGHRTSKKPFPLQPAQKNVRSGQQNLKSLSVASRLQKTVASTHSSSSSYNVSSARNISSSPVLSSARGSSSSPAVSSVCSSSSPSARSPVTSVNDAMSRSCGTEAVSSPEVPAEIGEKVVRIVRGNNENDSRTENDEASIKSPRFHLLRDGSSLKLPAELGKALAANHRLREKLKASFTAKPRKLREGESSSESFMLRLQKHMEDADADVFSHSQSCHRHGNVNDWLKSLLDRVAALNISEETSASVIFQAQKIVEFVLHEFFGQQEVLQSLVPQRLPAADRNTELNVRHKESMLHWFSSNPEDEEQLAPSARISYQTPDQLQKYMTLVHEVQVIRLQKFLLDEAGSQAIKLLKQLDPNDRLFRELYRASYSLICSLGQSFPSVVQNIEDDDEEDGGAEEEEKKEKKEKIGSMKDIDT